MIFFDLDRNNFNQWCLWKVGFGRFRSKPSISSSDSSPEPKSSYSESDILNQNCTKTYKNIYLALKNEVQKFSMCELFQNLLASVLWNRQVVQCRNLRRSWNGRQWLAKTMHPTSTLNRRSTPQTLIRLIHRPVVQCRRPVQVGTLWLNHFRRRTGA